MSKSPKRAPKAFISAVYRANRPFGNDFTARSTGSVAWADAQQNFFNSRFAWQSSPTSGDDDVTQVVVRCNIIAPGTTIESGPRARGYAFRSWPR
jgi:hypothetical protein